MSAATLHYTPELHAALRNIFAGQVVQSRWYNAGFEWSGGGQMPPAMQDTVDEVIRHGLAVPSQQGVPCRPRSVETTDDGEKQLVAWEFPARVAS
jgi:hypothetical protein